MHDFSICSSCSATQGYSLAGKHVGKDRWCNPRDFAGLQEKMENQGYFRSGIRELNYVGHVLGGRAMRGTQTDCRNTLPSTTCLKDLQPFKVMMLQHYQYRTKGGQKSTLIIRTRGHRLKGIWISGSPMGRIIHACGEIAGVVPREYEIRLQAFYQHQLRSDWYPHWSSSAEWLSH